MQRAESRFRLVPILLSVTLGFVTLASPTVAQPEPDVRADARARFDLGLEHYEAGRYEPALAEFRRAYDIAPAFQVLYNLGKVHAKLGQSVQALDAYEQYLKEGGPSISPQRQAEVQQALERQRQLVARVRVFVNVSPATIMLDGVDVAVAPLNTVLRVTAGKHTIGARAEGHETAQRSIQLAGNVEQSITFDLKRTIIERANLLVTSPLSDVTVLVDGKVVGTTPLQASIAVDPGTHTVIGRREGYLDKKLELDLESGAETQLRLDLLQDTQAPPATIGNLQLELPDAAYSLEVDGRAVASGKTRFTLPTGHHRLFLQVADRRDFKTDLIVPPEDTLILVPDLTWTPDARQELLDSAAAQRTWGWILAGGGAVVGATGIIIFAVADDNRSALEEDIEELTRELNTLSCQTAAADECFDPLSQQITDKRVERGQADDLRTAGIAVGATGVVTAAVGVVLWVLADSEEDIDARASAWWSPEVSTRVGASTVSLGGVF